MPNDSQQGVQWNGVKTCYPSVWCSKLRITTDVSQPLVTMNSVDFDLTLFIGWHEKKQQHGFLRRLDAKQRHKEASEIN
ncbi:hypothetical protein TNCV_2562661 [Trichonephila clavipes]|uniref:Uncharacterized protein n=1 Tax=Trichonephila clavipes TaxID=2585209 RepID=A0A8X6R5U6_TRICX|nr:hypothetical protein TNCV_2562661 [Trichonephila clavipes]